MKNIGKKIVEKYCKHQGYGNYSVSEEKLIKAINDALIRQTQVNGSLLIRSLQLLEEMIDNHDADAVRMADLHYTEVKKLIKDILGVQ